MASDNLIDAVEDLRERNHQILLIQRSAKEMLELFQDLNRLIDLQAESLNVIETRVLSAKDYIERGVQELHKAQDYQIKARKRKCCLMMILLAVLTVVILVVLGVTGQFKSA